MQALRDHFKEQGINLKGLLSSTCLEKHTHPEPADTMVWEGLTAVQTGWVTTKESKPVDSKPGTIPGDSYPSLQEHHSWQSSMESTETEINLWFQPEELAGFQNPPSPFPQAGLHSL